MGLDWLENLKKEQWYRSLSYDDKQRILQDITAGQNYMPIAEDCEVNNGVDSIDKVLEEQERRALPLQINTILMTIRGEDGNGGLVAGLKCLTEKVDAFTSMYYDMDKKHAMLEKENNSEHTDIRKDIDGVGRKAQRAIDISEDTKKRLDDYEKAVLKEEKTELKTDIKDKDTRKFTWTHAIVIGIILAVVEVVFRVLVG